MGVDRGHWGFSDPRPLGGTLMRMANVSRVGKDYGPWFLLIFFGTTTLELIFYRVGHGLQLEILLGLVVAIVSYGMAYRRAKRELRSFRSSKAGHIEPKEL